MSVRRVLYASKVDRELQAQLRIVTFKKANSRGKKNNKVYFVEFASQADAEAAGRRCRRLGNMTLKEYQPHCTENKSTLPILQSQPPPPTTTTTTTTTPPPVEPSTQPRLKVRHVSSQLAPNSPVVRTLVDSLQSCLAVIENVQKTADRIRGLHSEQMKQRDRIILRCFSV